MSWGNARPEAALPNMIDHSSGIRSDGTFRTAAGRMAAVCALLAILTWQGGAAGAAELVEVAAGQPLVSPAFEPSNAVHWLSWAGGLLILSLSLYVLWQLRRHPLLAHAIVDRAAKGPRSEQDGMSERGGEGRTAGCPLPETKELEQTTHALAEAQRRLTDLERRAKMGYWRWSPSDTRFTVWSDGLRQVCGLAANETPSVLEDFHLLVHPGDRHYVMTEHQAAISSECDLELTFCLVRPNGEARHVALSETVRKGDEGTVVARDCILQDITERKEAEDARRKSEAKFRHLSEGSLQGVVIERDLKPLFANEALAKMFGYDSVADALALDSVLELATPDQQPAIKQLYYEQLRGQTAPRHFELLGRKRNGIPIWLDIATRPISWDGRRATQWTIVDITERKLAEEALLENEARYRSLFDESPVSIWEADWSDLKRFVGELQAEGVTDLEAHLKANPKAVAEAVSRIRVIDFNKATMQIYRAASGETLWEQMDQFLDGTYWDHLPEQIAAFAQGETRFVTESRERALDGSELVVRILREIPEAYRNNWGRVIEIVEDITERKDAEAALRESEARFRDLFDGAPISIWEEDWTGVKDLIDDLRKRGIEDFARHFEENPDIRAELPTRIEFLDFNDAAAELFGAADKRDLWNRLESLRSTTSWLGLEEAITAFTAGAKGHSRDAPDTNLHGETIWLHESYKLLGNDPDDWSRVIVIMENITERKNAEDALQKSEARFRVFIDNSPAAILLKDLQGHYVLVNKRFEEWLDRPASEIRGKTCFDIFPEEDAELYTRLERAVEESGEATQRELDLPIPDGTTRRLITTKFPVLDADGKAIGIGTINTDVTEQREVEALLRQAQKMEAIGQLTGGVAHDFNNLLAVILGNLELLDEHLKDDQEAKKMLDPSLGATRRGAELTNRLLAFARRQPLEPQNVDLGELIDGLTSVLRRTLGETVQINTLVSKKLWPTLIDPLQMENALLNLAVNARDAMPGGGKLTIEATNVSLSGGDVRQKEGLNPGRYVSLVVSDTGSGMPPEVAEQAFEPFFTTKEVGKGSGLGLSMVYGFIKQSGGHCEIDSRQGEGTAITLYLPMAEAEASSRSKAAGKPRDAQATGEVVLIVEDDPDVRALTLRQVDTLGYRVLEAPDGPSALALLNEDVDIDLLLTDVMLPNGMTGVELAKEALRLRPGLRVLYMSGYSQDALMQATGYDEQIKLIDKPFTRDDLARKMRETFDQPAV